jgi:hypothetical protein
MALVLVSGPVVAQEIAYEYIYDYVANTIRANDPSALVAIHNAGQGERTVEDRRTGGDVTINARLFQAEYDGGSSLEVIANPEFGLDEARTRAYVWAYRLGQIPRALRERVTTIVLHRGNQPPGARNGRILIHTGQLDNLSRTIPEELLMHEATHAGFWSNERSINWRLAQAADNAFISAYAARVPTGEDMAETVPAWVALRYRRDRLAPEVADRLESLLPNRLAYLDGLGWDMHPIEARSTGSETVISREGLRVEAPFPNPSSKSVRIGVDIGRPGMVQVSVFDIRGREIAVLESGYLGSGHYRFEWDGRDTVSTPIRSGVFFIRVQTDAGAEIKPVVLLR